MLCAVPWLVGEGKVVFSLDGGWVVCCVLFPGWWGKGRWFWVVGCILGPCAVCAILIMKGSGARVDSGCNVVAKGLERKVATLGMVHSMAELGFRTGRGSGDRCIKAQCSRTRFGMNLVWV